MELGQRLRQARLEAGLSQRQLCGDTITRNMLSQIENGSARPSMDTLQYLAGRLGKPVSFFLEENAVLSENQEIMAQSRQAYAACEYGHTLALLKEYRSPDPVFDAEAYLLQTLTLLALAQTAVAEERLPYAARLLEQAKQAGEQTPYFTPQLARSVLLLQAQALPGQRGALLQQLTAEDSELLLRAQCALEQGDYPRAAALLDAAADPTAEFWAYLRGEAAFGLGDFAKAAELFRRAENTMPKQVLSRLEACYLQLEDYKMAYFYADKQRK